MLLFGLGLYATSSFLLRYLFFSWRFIHTKIPLRDILWNKGCIVVSMGSPCSMLMKLKIVYSSTPHSHIAFGFGFGLLNHIPEKIPERRKEESRSTQQNLCMKYKYWPISQ